jgi:ankyrin repeat protein
MPLCNVGSADVDVVNKASKSAGELASENGQSEVAKFISEYKVNADTQNKLLHDIGHS